MTPVGDEYGLKSVEASISLQEKSVNSNYGSIVITPDPGRVLSKATVVGPVNKGAWVANTSNKGNVVIPEGYHNGQGYVNTDGAYNKGVSDADGRTNVNSENYKAGYNQGYEAGKSAGGICTILRCNAGILEGNTTSHRSDFNLDCTGKSHVEFDYCGYANSGGLRIDVYSGINFNNNVAADWYGNPWEWNDATKIATIDSTGNSVRHASINIPAGKKWISFIFTNTYDQYAGVEIRNLRMT